MRWQNKLATMSEKAVWIAYTISNIIALLLLLGSWKLPHLTRLLFALLFGGGAWVNATTALEHPEFYLYYATDAVPVYRAFIQGWFARHSQEMVLLIASGQVLIALSMFTKGCIFRSGCLGGIIFLLAIAPLGVGSAFPFSLTAGVALWLLYRRSSAHFLWEKINRKNNAKRDQFSTR